MELGSIGVDMRHMRYPSELLSLIRMDSSVTGDLAVVDAFVRYETDLAMGKSLVPNTQAERLASITISVPRPSACASTYRTSYLRKSVCVGPETWCLDLSMLAGEVRAGSRSWSTREKSKAETKRAVRMVTSSLANWDGLAGFRERP